MRLIFHVGKQTEQLSQRSRDCSHVCVSRETAVRDVHVLTLNPGNLGLCSSTGPKKLCSVSKLRISRSEDYPDYLGARGSVITRALEIGGKEAAESEEMGQSKQRAEECDH